MDVVLNVTVVVPPLTFPSGFVDVNVMSLGKTLKLLTDAPRGSSPNVRAVTAANVSRTALRIGRSLFQL